MKDLSGNTVTACLFCERELRSHNKRVILGNRDVCIACEWKILYLKRYFNKERERIEADSNEGGG